MYFSPDGPARLNADGEKEHRSPNCHCLCPKNGSIVRANTEISFMGLATLSPLIRLLQYYQVPDAGAQIGLGRTLSYDAARAGLIPTEKYGRFLLVPRVRWDARVRKILRRRQPKLTKKMTAVRTRTAG
jgi:hypothetical protein